MKQFLIAALFSGAFGTVAMAEESPITIQFNVCMPAADAAKALGISLADAKTKATYIFESQDFLLYQNKIQIRAKGNKHPVLSVKNFEVSDSVVAALQAKGATCEFDVHAGAKTGSCKFDLDITTDQLQSLVQGKTALINTITKDQIYLIDYQGSVSRSLQGVRALGPLQDTSVEVPASAGGPAVMSLDISKTPKGTDFLEVKSISDNAGWQKQMGQVSDWLKKKNVTLCPDQSGARLRKFQDLLK